MSKFIQALAVATMMLAAGCNSDIAVNATITATASPSPTMGGSSGGSGSGGGGGTTFTLTLTSVSPVTVPANGFTITLNGNFQAGLSITVGGSPCTSFNLVSSTQATCQLNSLTGGAKDVQVTVAGQTVTLPQVLTVNPAPTISGISPATSFTAGGSTLTISGTGYLAGATVTIGSTACPTASVTATQITCTIPSGSASTNAITVTNTDAQAATDAASFTYVSTPTIASLADANLKATTVINPTAGSVLNVMGSGFSAGAVVKLNGTACSTTTVVSSNQLTCTQTGAVTSGKYTVTALSAGQTATAPSQIRYAKATKLFRNNFYTGAALMSDGTVMYWRPLGQVMFASQNQSTALAHPLLSNDLSTELTGVVDLAVTPDGNTLYAVLNTGQVMYFDGLSYNGAGTFLYNAFGWTNGVNGATSWSMGASTFHVGYVPSMTAVTALAVGNDYGCAYQNLSPTQVWCWGNSYSPASINPTQPTTFNASTISAPYRITYMDGIFSGANWSMAATNTQLCFTNNGGAANNSSYTICAGANVYLYNGSPSGVTASASPQTYTGLGQSVPYSLSNTYKGFSALSSGGNMGICGASQSGKDVVCMNGAYDDATFGLGVPQQLYSTGGAVIPTGVSIVSDQFMFNHYGTAQYYTVGGGNVSAFNGNIRYPFNTSYPAYQYNTIPGAVCILFSDGHVSCSGSTGLFGEGLKGDGSTTQNLSWQTNVPNAPQTNSFSTSVLLPSGAALNATQISSECALDATGTIYCWGGNQELTNDGNAQLSTSGSANSILYNKSGVTTPLASIFTGKSVAMTFGN